MTPVQVLTDLLRVDQKVALPLLAGLAVIAAAAIVATWDVDFQSAVLVGLYIVGIGAILYLVAYLLTAIADPIVKRIFGWFIVFFVILVMMTFFVSAAFPGATPVAPTPCLVRFWEHCAKVGDEVAVRNYTPIKAPVPTGPVPIAAVRTSDYQVFVQFAGIIRREDVREMMTKLRNTGWRVQGVDGGGQRTAKAAGVNEIRYTNPDDEAAANVLARAVQMENLTPKPINATRVAEPPIARRTLEVWVSR